MIIEDDLRNIKKDNKFSQSVIGYKCTNCHEISLNKNDADECCPE